MEKMKKGYNGFNVKENKRWDKGEKEGKIVKDIDEGGNYDKGNKNKNLGNEGDGNMGDLKRMRENDEGKVSEKVVDKNIKKLEEIKKSYLMVNVGGDNY